MEVEEKPATTLARGTIRAEMERLINRPLPGAGRGSVWLEQKVTKRRQVGIWDRPEVLKL